MDYETKKRRDLELVLQGKPLPDAWAIDVIIPPPRPPELEGEPLAEQNTIHAVFPYHWPPPEGEEWRIDLICWFVSDPRFLSSPLAGYTLSMFSLEWKYIDEESRNKLRSVFESIDLHKLTDWIARRYLLELFAEECCDQRALQRFQDLAMKEDTDLWPHGLGGLVMMCNHTKNPQFKSELKTILQKTDDRGDETYKRMIQHALKQK